MCKIIGLHVQDDPSFDSLHVVRVSTPGHHGLGVQHGYVCLEHFGQGRERASVPARKLREPEPLLVHLRHLDHEAARGQAPIRHFPYQPYCAWAAKLSQAWAIRWPRMACMPALSSRQKYVRVAPVG